MSRIFPFICAIGLYVGLNYFSSAVPINNITDALEDEVVDLRRNLSEVWEVLKEFQSRLERLEGEEEPYLCNETDVIESLAEIHTTEIHPKGREDEDEDEEDDDDDDDDEKDWKKGKKDGQHHSHVTPHTDSPSLSQGSREDGKYQQEHHRQRPIKKCQPSFSQQRHHMPIRSGPEIKANVTAYCSIRPNKALPPESRLDVRGRIYITQKDGTKLIFNVKVSGLLKDSNQSFTYNSTKKHGFHVHQYGNLTNGCESAGPHYNPFNHTHGSPHSSKRHLGDFGNVESDDRGNIDTTFEINAKEALTGPNSLIGRTLVIHEKADDLGSNPGDPGSMSTGNAGARLACCIIYKMY